MKNTTLQRLTVLIVTILISLGCTRTDLSDNPINQEEPSIVKKHSIPSSYRCPYYISTAIN